MKILKFLDRSLVVVMIAAAVIFVLDHYGYISFQSIVDAFVS